MIISVLRYSHGKESTLSLIFIDGKFEAYGLEDEFREKKVMHETRIPEGTYKVELRTFGGHHEKYTKRFPFHKGMLWVKDVPGFTDILIHCGNTANDTSGCLLVGDTANNNQVTDGQITNSTEAYSRFYQKVVKAFDKKEPVTIKYARS